MRQFIELTNPTQRQHAVGELMHAIKGIYWGFDCLFSSGQLAEKGGWRCEWLCERRVLEEKEYLIKDAPKKGKRVEMQRFEIMARITWRNSFAVYVMSIVVLRQKTRIQLLLVRDQRLLSLLLEAVKPMAMPGSNSTYLISVV